MCGIVGLLDWRLAEGEMRVRLKQMTDCIVHRGPDDEGFFATDGVGLGMRRLSIIDLASGQQPICNEDGTIQLIQNGEIYNYRELRDSLQARGHRFQTNSDTEVLVHAYEQDGEHFLSQLRGMYALALWDARRETLLIAIDRFGIKPLYYAVMGQTVVFGSELKSLRASNSIPNEINFAALAQYMALGYIPATASIMSGVQKLAPGGYLKAQRNGSITVASYWDWSNVPVEHGRSPAQLRAQLREMLQDAVRSHLVSDVPLGAFLSGGIDSSAVVALMSKVSADRVKTFSIGFADQEHDESVYAEQVAARYHTEHHKFIVEPETVEVLPKLAGFFDEPFADPAALPTYYLSKLARQHVTVALSGDGGDELFLGYSIFRGLELARYLQRLPHAVRGAITGMTASLPLGMSSSWNDRLTILKKQVADSLLEPEQAYRSKLTLTGSLTAWDFISPDLARELEGYNPFRAIDESLKHYASENGGHRATTHPLERFVYAGLKVPLAGGMLVKADRMSMANSLELRVPLLDNTLAEFVAGIPIEQRFPNWRLKGLLKDTMQDALPPEVLNHPKHGFTVPLTSWFRGDLNSYAADVLLSSDARARGFWNDAAIEQLLQRQRHDSPHFGTTVWTLLMFELWCTQVWDGRRLENSVS